MTQNRMNPVDRFWLHVNKNGRLLDGMETNCWEWDKTAKTSHQVSFNVGDEVMAIHLFSFRQFVGVIPHGMLVLRKCRNLECVRPDHLFLGTMRDAHGKRFVDVDGIEKKICVTCHKVFPYTEEYFYPANWTNSTVRFISSCKSCSRSKSLKGRETYWARLLWHSCKTDSSPRGLPFELEPEDILDLYEKQRGKCYWFGVDLVPSSKHKYPLKPSLDRLNRHLGYTKDNVVLCCLAANMGRNSSSEEDFKEFVLVLKDGISISLWR